jgi:prepilin-type N-terminal cleavage/methylation domain-containing protein
MRNHARPRARAFSLLEVLVTVSILGLLASMVAVSVHKQRDLANRNIADINAKQLRNSALAWISTHGASECPTRDRLIDDGVIDEAGAPNDPWGGAYVIECKDDRVSVRSAGPDKSLNTEDDIVAPPLVSRRH